MKKHFILLFAAFAAGMACSTIEINAPKDDSSRQLTFTGLTETTKTTLESDYSITWSTEDKISVFHGTDAAAVQFDVTATAGSFAPEANLSVATASTSNYTFRFSNVGELPLHV